MKLDLHSIQEQKRENEKNYAKREKVKRLQSLWEKRRKLKSRKKITTTPTATEEKNEKTKGVHKEVCTEMRK